MKKLRLLSLALFVPVLFASSAGARVLETREQCVTRYGKAVGTVQTTVGSNVTFSKNNVSVTVEFRKDTAVAVTYSKSSSHGKSDENRAWSKEEVRKLLELNGGERVWGKVQTDMHGNPYWKTNDGALTARLTGELYLRVEDNAEFLRRAKDIPPEVKPAPRDLEGF